MIDIVVVNWNAGPLLAQCLTSIFAHGDGLAASVVVVDNGSSDGSDKIAEEHPSVNLLRAGENLGFGRACNRGARDGSADYLLFLNPDARLLPGTLRHCTEFMEAPENHDVGICGARLLDDDLHVTKSCSRFPSALNVFARASGLDRIVPTWGQKMIEWDHNYARCVDQVMGAFFLIRRDLFTQLGGFDERFFVYFEEVDLSKRCRDAGWKSWFVADAKAVHIGGGTTSQVKAHRLFYSLRSRIQYSEKHFGNLSRLMIFITTLVVEPISRSALLLSRGRFYEFIQTAKGYRMLLAWLLVVRPEK